MDWLSRPFARDENAARSCDLFLRMLGLTYFVAFASLATQILGLLGHDGILPAADLLREVAEQVGVRRYLLLPTLCWISPGDGFLLFLCIAGAALGLGLAVLRPGGVILFLLWLFYLSLVSVGQDFLGFQWDGLLLETGLLAIFLAPFRLVRRAAAPPVLVLWLLRFLLFRLMFSSGCVKLTSGDETWRNLTALHHHFETQPLPTLLACYVHQLPGAIKSASVVLMLMTEILAPFLLFAKGRWRMAGALIQVLFQIVLALTGGFAFFNLLTVTLCVSALSDEMLQGLLRRPAPPSAPPDPSKIIGWRRLPLVLLTLLVLPLSLLHLATVFVPRRSLPRPVRAAIRMAAPLHLSSPYGLFAVMTRTRPEIIIEGSRDGRRWQAYEFNYKPGDVHRRPEYVAPHQPRLDWQMWFAALGTSEQSPWFMNLCLRLLEGRSSVLSLLKHNPFPGSPPRYVRAVLYDYHFESLGARRSSHAWWRRSELGPYTQVLSLRESE